MFASVLKILSALLGLPALIAGWFQRRADRQQGAAEQAAHTTAVSMGAESRIAQAEASAPRTDSQLEARLRDESF